MNQDFKNQDSGLLDGWALSMITQRNTEASQSSTEIKKLCAPLCAPVELCVRLGDHAHCSASWLLVPPS